MSIIILAIESSCDDTAAAVIRDGVILSNVVASQEIHRQYGGVVPEVASRAHQENIVPVVDTALHKAEISLTELSAIAYTKGPGLIGSLIVGAAFAKSMALGLQIPLIEVHHMQAHVLAHFAEEPKPALPFLCLTVSGGHTQIVLVKTHLDMKVLGQTLDDAAGEAFDKTGKMLGLEYPAGPLIDKLAQIGKPVYTFPEPQVAGLDFSFSGLKTSILYFIKEKVKDYPNFIQENMADICASVQTRIVTILMKKMRLAAQMTGIREIAIAGGVSANSGLRAELKSMGKKEGWNTYVPSFEYCTDNAAMIAVTAHFKFIKGDFAGQDSIPVARYET